MNQPKVSVVVPIYNVEKYLKQCLDSIVNQTLQDIEIILINDGSTDTSGNIALEYTNKDHRITLINQENSGYGVAVNRGITKATGEYIAIVESDDFINFNMYETLYNNAKQNNTDITKCNFYTYNSYAPINKQSVVFKQKHRDLSTAPKGVFNILEYPQLLIFHSSIWAAIYKADFIKKLKFVETESSSYQDFPFMVEALVRAERISVVNEPQVFYRNEPQQNSSTSRSDSKLLIMPKQCNKAIETLKSCNLYDKLKEEIYYHIFIANLGFYQNITQKHKEEYFNLLHNLFAGLEEDKNFTYKYFNKKKIKLIKYFIKGKYIEPTKTSWFKSIKSLLIKE
ncbi:MAG: glycosyltransferase [Alphaproteobacteria bacterium]|jgi:glycosyltransferase involved in cell wall biosynthesis|nr:glycosyltransferase [Alphaproteobacteria bacterium]